MKTRKLTALLLALCMLLSLSISAFAADDAVASGTIPDSKITWELDSKGWLTISGSGDCSAFTSKDDQPWAEYRGQITQVWFDGMESLAISDLAYWFEDCTNLTTAEIPNTTPVIGRHAFYNCPLLTKLSIYYGEHTLGSIGEDAFWRETDNGDTLYVAYIIGYADVRVNGSAYGTAINPYASAASVGNGGDGFDLSWAVDENGVPVHMSSAKYIRVYSAVLFNAGIFGETSAEVCGLYRTSNTITDGAGMTARPTVKRNGVAIDFAGKTAKQIDENVVYVKSKLAVGNTITVEDTGNAVVFINGEVRTSYTVTTTAKPVQIVVQNGDAEPYIVVLK